MKDVNANGPRPPAIGAEMVIYRFCWIVALVMVVAPLVSATLDARLAADPADKLTFYGIAMALIAINVYLRFRIKGRTGKFPGW